MNLEKLYLGNGKT